VIGITRESSLSAAEIEAADFSFHVTEEAVPPFDGSALARTVAVQHYSKSYALDPALLAPAQGERLLAAARDDGRLLGYLLATPGWNGFASIDDFAIVRDARRLGLGRRLMDEALLWAGEMELPGLRAETQSNNVPACRFYEASGFRLGGFDRHLYDALGQERHETALFWYRFLPS
jgi:ribosomal protein S18 acetylase RimI-like enzyme